MYTLQPVRPKTASKRNTWFTFVIVAGIALAVMWALSFVGTPLAPKSEIASARLIQTQKALAAQVELHAKPWNNGMVHVWHDLVDGPNAMHTDVPESASCTRLDDRIYKLGSGSTTIRYYKLACNGVVRYVEVDQVR